MSCVDLEPLSFTGEGGRGSSEGVGVRAAGQPVDVLRDQHQHGDAEERPVRALHQAEEEGRPAQETGGGIQKVRLIRVVQPALALSVTCVECLPTEKLLKL